MAELIERPELVIVSDSGSGYCPGDVTNKYLEFVPFDIQVKDSSAPADRWIDSQDLTPEEEAIISEHLDTPGKLGTSQPNKSRFKEHLTKIFDEGAKRAVVITLAGIASGSNREASNAALEINDEYGEENKVLVADSHTMSLAQRFLVDEAVQSAIVGDKTPEQIAQTIEAGSQKIHVVQIARNLRHLQEGGRGDERIRLVDKMRASAGAKLGIRALISLSNEKVVPIVPTNEFPKKERLAQEMAVEYLARLVGDSAISLYFAQFDAKERELQSFIDLVEARLDRNLSEKQKAKIKILKQAYVITVHSGKDTKAAAALALG